MTTSASPAVKDANINASGIVRLVPPYAMKDMLTATEALEIDIAGYQKTIKEILEGKDERLIGIVGPCSIHDPKAAFEYAKNLKGLAREVSPEIFIVMRLYPEKPRSIVGWKGMFQDPNMKMNGCADINLGARKLRQLALEVSQLGLPIGMEVLDPWGVQYIDDLLAWSCIGARTIESQPHRELASGLSSPVGCKNSTDGSIKGAIDAVESINHPHGFFGMDDDGRVAWFPSTGNPYAHVVLRGGYSGSNYDEESIAAALGELKKRNLREALVIDCSHGNSAKDYRNQGKVLSEIVRQRRAGNTKIIGFMLESNLVAGRQDIVPDKELVYGQSITDGCIGWCETEQIVHAAASAP